MRPKTQPRLIETADLPLFSGTAPRAEVEAYQERERGPQQMTMPEPPVVAVTIYDDDSTEQEIDVKRAGKRHSMILKHNTRLAVGMIDHRQHGGDLLTSVYEHPSDASFTRLQRLIMSHSM